MGEDVDCSSQPWLEIKRRIKRLLHTYQDVNVSLTNTKSEFETFKGVSYAYKFSIVVLASAYFTLRLLCELRGVYRDHNLQFPSVLCDKPRRTKWPNLEGTVYGQEGFAEYEASTKRDDMKFQHNKVTFSNIVDARH